MKIKELQDTIAICAMSPIFMLALVMVNIIHGWIITSIIAWIIWVLLGVITHTEFIKLRDFVWNLPRADVLPMLREQRIFRPLANRLLMMVGIPTILPTQALAALYPDRDYFLLGPPYSPLDCSVYWDQLDSHPKTWIWRRADRSFGTFQDSDGKWRLLLLADP